MTEKHWEILERLFQCFPDTSIVLNHNNDCFHVTLTCVGKVLYCSNATEEMSLDHTVEQLVNNITHVFEDIIKIEENK